MAEELDTSWFDLKNYEVFKTMSIEEWTERLALRSYYHEAFSRYKLEQHDEIGPYLIGFLEQATSCLKMGNMSFILEHAESSQFSSVRNLVMFEVFEMAQDERLTRMQPDRCKEEFIEEIAMQPFGFWDDERKASITVNLCATDEQIKRDFSQWLTDCRQATAIKPPKKILTQTDFDYWVKYGVIPYIDLMLISRFEGKRITQNKLAQLIFPDEYDVDIVGRLRQVTKPEAENIINNAIHETISAQLSLKTQMG